MGDTLHIELLVYVKVLFVLFKCPKKRNWDIIRLNIHFEFICILSYLWRWFTLSTYVCPSTRNPADCGKHRTKLLSGTSTVHVCNVYKVYLPSFKICGGSLHQFWDTDQPTWRPPNHDSQNCINPFKLHLWFGYINKLSNL